MKTINKILFLLFPFIILLIFIPQVHAQLDSPHKKLLNLIKVKNFEKAKELIISLGDEGKCPEDVARVVLDKINVDQEKKPAFVFLEFCINKIKNKNGLNPNIQSSDGRTPVMLALIYNQPELAQKIMENELFDPNIKDSEGSIAAQFALDHSHKKIAKLIIGHKNFNVNNQGKKGWTIAGIAMDTNNLEMARSIINNDQYDPNLQNDDGLTDAMIAAENLSPELVEMIIKNKYFDPHLKNREGFNLAQVMMDNIPDSKQLASLLSQLLAKGAFFSGLFGQSLFDELTVQGQSELADKLRVTLRGDALPEWDCAEEEMNHHIAVNDIAIARDIACILCLENHSLTFIAHPENKNCQGICGSCHKDYLQHLAENGRTMETFCCPSQKCQQPLTLPYLMAPHYAKENLVHVNRQEEFPVTDTDQVKKILKIDHEKRIAPLPGIIHCPAENCLGFMIKAKTSGKLWFQCPLCEQQRFLGDQENSSDAATKSFLAEGIKKGTHFHCPSCQKLIEKNEGCHHMSCCQCRHEFIVPTMQDFRKHCPKCDKMVTTHSYQKERLEVAKCPLCEHKFIWDDAKTYHQK